MSISELICVIKKDKEKFYLLLHKFQPLIKKYVNSLYKDEKEDVYAEFAMALWEAVCSIQYFSDDGQVVKYLSIALKNKYLELYRKSRKYNDYIIEVEDAELEKKKSVDNIYDVIILQSDIERIRNNLQGNKKQIFELLFFKGYTDLQAAIELDISRQYVHRVKMSLIKMMKEVLDINNL